MNRHSTSLPSRLFSAQERLRRAGWREALGYQRAGRLRVPPLRLRSIPDGVWSEVGPSFTVPSSRELFDLALAVVGRAIDIQMDRVAERCKTPNQKRWVTTYPGEHYKLLAALSDVVRPRSVVEIGTGSGLGTLSILEGHSACSVVTYDLIPVSQFEDSVLDESVVGWEQRIGDLSDPSYFANQLGTLAGADLIVLDGPKYGRFERLVLPKLTSALPKERPRYLLIDDIRLLNMAGLWGKLGTADKCDLSSFGHWSGTGLVKL